jgi:hypothetical protein
MQQEDLLIDVEAEGDATDPNERRKVQPLVYKAFFSEERGAESDGDEEIEREGGKSARPGEEKDDGKAAEDERLLGNVAAYPGASGWVAGKDCETAADEQAVETAVGSDGNEVERCSGRGSGEAIVAPEGACESADGCGVESASGAKEGKQSGPEEVEVLFNGERPEMSCVDSSCWRRQIVAEEEERAEQLCRVHVAYEPEDCKSGYGEEIEDDRWKDAKSAAAVEGGEVEVVSFMQEARCDDVAADEEE